VPRPVWPVVVMVVLPVSVRGGGGPPGHGEQRRVQDDGQRVPRVVDGRDGRHRVHGPVEAQPPRVYQQPDVLGRQIEERQCPGDQTG